MHGATIISAQNIMLFHSFRARGFLLLLLLLLAHTAFGQSTLRLNEIMCVNTRTFQDEDKEFVDWIELFNATSQPINLEGYGLSDDRNEPFKWQFPSTNIQPQAYVLVF